MDSVTICNMALSAIGARSRIVSLSEQSPEAAECNLHYEQTLLGLLRMTPWRWARANVALAVWKARRGTPENPDGTATADPEWPWMYSYLYPAECAKARYILPQLALNNAAAVPPLTSAGEMPVLDETTPPIRFAEASDVDNTNPSLPVQKKVILTNQPQARLIFTRITTDPDIWDQNFIDAFIGRLAAKISFNLSGDKTLTKNAIAAGKVAEEEAKASIANEGVDIKDWQPEAQAAGGFIDPSSTRDYQGIVSQDVD